MKNNVVIIVGPTAVGKTQTSIQIAKRFNGEIISADSMQIYKYMDIGTAKPSVQEQEGIQHHLINVIPPDEEFSVAVFQENAKKLLNDITIRNNLPIVVGGTGLYINSLLFHMDFSKTQINSALRDKLKQESIDYGNQYLHDKLKSLAPDVADRIHKNNVKRVIRAIEVCMQGENFKDFSKELKLNCDYNYIIIGLTRQREELYERINKRVDIMISEGLINEVKKLLDSGYSSELVSMKGLGYKEVIQYLNNVIDYNEMVNILKRDTRRYAKRQLTWFRRFEFIKWYNISEYESDHNLESDIKKYIEDRLN
ncbi:tRNA (adenosine(37)-N6)-dimethylallyltransferase MiaA [Serpentinicella sp. ANB-PHB4]|uniref:tRNA (adenosine(37)-N6)-dimethylallyltransferase MiaA n=1 Tax=Serpentinicella sp. ANB-PHB4 TaxID=3074076 RepID=UPI002861220E|nr:tRNA (adenosine(37)-N6)-dimethylallyltransferase MiaA [Serpentinicella sp. ANB-PHB4]MDR5658150.1 tRNA (adenosine(37)-N6)-dimethylallyltransferase MiaA [Serpentinicella sp. ANB-PHB4]